METQDRWNEGCDERGLGLVEILVSMFMLALISVALLPLLVQGLQVSVKNATVATASQLVGQQLDQVRALAKTCADVSAFDDAPLANFTNERGDVFQPVRLVGACPASYPGLVRVDTWVTANGTAEKVAEASTLVYVETAAP